MHCFTIVREHYCRSQTYEDIDVSPIQLTIIEIDLIRLNQENKYLFIATSSKSCAINYILLNEQFINTVLKNLEQNKQTYQDLDSLPAFSSRHFVMVRRQWLSVPHDHRAIVICPVLVSECRQNLREIHIIYAFYILCKNSKILKFYFYSSKQYYYCLNNFKTFQFVQILDS